MPPPPSVPAGFPGPVNQGRAGGAKAAAGPQLGWPDTRIASLPRPPSGPPSEPARRPRGPQACPALTLMSATWHPASPPTGKMPKQSKPCECPAGWAEPPPESHRCPPVLPRRPWRYFPPDGGRVRPREAPAGAEHPGCYCLACCSPEDGCSGSWGDRPGVGLQAGHFTNSGFLELPRAEPGKHHSQFFLALEKSRVPGDSQ